MAYAAAANQGCPLTEEGWTFLFSQCKRGQKKKNLLMLSIVTRATVRTGAALHGHWCMGRSFMRPGVWSIDSLTSALREAFDGLETRARVPAVIHTCYQSVKKEKKESVVGQAWMNHIKGVGKRQVALEVTLVMLWARLTQSVATWSVFYAFFLDKT